MNSAESNIPKKLLTLVQAAQKLGVSVDTLLEWNEHHILKPTITAKGSIGYPAEQIEQFLNAKHAVKADPTPASVTAPETQSNEIIAEVASEAAESTLSANVPVVETLTTQHVQEANVVPLSEPQTNTIATPPSSQPKQTSIYHQFMTWIGEGLYSDNDVKDHLKTQVKESLSFNFSMPSLPPLPSFKRSPEKCLWA